MALTLWPNVLDEYATLEKLHDGSVSLSRFGDGEWKLMRGQAQVREPANPLLAAELRKVITHPHSRCLIGIPRLFADGPKNANWLSRSEGMLPFLSSQVSYVSAFVTRPDSCPAIRTRAYAERMVALWTGKRVALVSESGAAIHRLVERTVGTGTLVHIACPHRETYAVIDRLEATVVKARPDIALLSCGPAATCLANRLTHHGIQAIDIGSAGGFLLRELYGPTGTLRVFALGLPKTGTVSLQRALESIGMRVAHQHPRWLHPTEATGVLLLRAHADRRDPMAYLPGCEAVVHPSVLTDTVSCWPQVHTKLLRSLRAHHPECVFVLNTRPVEHWIRSMTGWKDLRQRLTAADIPGLRPGRGEKDRELARWATGHWETMRRLFAGMQQFVEIDIEQPAQCEARLTAALGQHIVWPWANRSIERMKGVA